MVGLADDLGLGKILCRLLAGLLHAGVGVGVGAGWWMVGVGFGLGGGGSALALGLRLGLGWRWPWESGCIGCGGLRVVSETFEMKGWADQSFSLSLYLIFF